MPKLLDEHIDDTWVDGVPTFWIDTGRPRLTASLRFRQGMADETPQTTGWTHLVEHLCLHERDQGGLTVNGRTGLLQTSLDFHGAPDAVVQGLRAVTSWLAAPDLSRLRDEAKVLRAEAATRGTAGIAEALSYRFGARGPGLVALAEVGLWNADPDNVGDWLRHRFTAGNAVLCLDGPPPADLRLDLPQGQPRPTPPAQPLALDGPAAYATQASTISGTGLLPRSVRASVMMAIAERLLVEELRRDAAGAYAPSSVIEAVDADTVVATLHSDLTPELAETVIDRWFGVLERLQQQRYDPELITHIAQSAHDNLRDPYTSYSQCITRADRYLTGREPQTAEQWLAEVDAVDQQLIAEYAREWAAGQLLAVPPGVRWSQQLPLLQRPTMPAATGGTVYGIRPQKYGIGRGPDRIIRITDEVIVATAAENGAIFRGARIDQIAAMLRYPDGGRVLVDSAGWQTRIEPTLLIRGHRATRHLDTILAPELWIDAPARDPQVVPRAARMSQGARIVDLAIPIGVGALFAVMAATASITLAIVIFVVIAALTLGLALRFDRLPFTRR